MNVNSLISYFENPDLLEQVDISELEHVVKMYPYFTLGQVLLTKKMQQTQHLLLKKAIKKSAVMLPNRKFLYEFLFQQEIRSSISEYENPEETELVNQRELPIEKPETTPIHAEIVEDVTEVKLPEVEASSFIVPIEIPSQLVQPSTFPTSVNLGSLTPQKDAEMDLLEKQIIGLSLEYAISQELEATSQPNSPIPTEPKKAHMLGKQKFSEWLEILDQNRLKDLRQHEQNPTFSEKDLINSFLSKNPAMIKSTENTSDFSPNNLARLSVVDDENFVTETLANIYEKQGNFQKGINAFKKLILKYPEKKIYFAARIEKLEQHLKTK